jgi:hypothetical protein
MEKDELLQGPIGKAEKELGKRWQEFTEAENLLMLGIAFDHNKRRTEHFDLQDDTHYNSPLIRTTRILSDYGFTKVIEDFGEWEKGTKDSYQLWLHDRDMIVEFTTWSLWKSGPKVNGGTLYASLPIKTWDKVPLGSRSTEGDWNYHSWSIHEGLRNLIATILQSYPQKFPWENETIISHPSFIGIGEGKGNMDSYRKARQKAEKKRLPILLKALGIKSLYGATT